MGSWLVQQPNGRFARWSTMVDNFTDYELTEAEARALVSLDLGFREAHHAITQVTANPKAVHAFERAIDRIRAVHGADEAESVRALCSATPDPPGYSDALSELHRAVEEHLFDIAIRGDVSREAHERGLRAIIEAHSALITRVMAAAQQVATSAAPTGG